MSFLALLIKVLTSVLYAFGIAFIFGSGIGNTSKRSDETESEYRRRAAASRTTGIMLVLHHIFIAFIVHKTTRCSGFTGETLNFAFGNRYEQLMAATE